MPTLAEYGVAATGAPQGQSRLAQYALTAQAFPWVFEQNGDAAAAQAARDAAAERLRRRRTIAAPTQPTELAP